VNNKYVKYFLLVAVIGIWAAILFRVIRGLGSGPSREILPAPMASAPLQAAPDSFSLYADYPDPFLPESDSASADSLPKTGHGGLPAALTSADSPPTQETVNGIIQFNGIIANPAKKSKVAIVTIRGKEWMVKENEKIGDIRIRKIGKDQVFILYKGDLFAIGK
jgi:hypothetical protein